MDIQTSDPNEEDKKKYSLLKKELNELNKRFRKTVEESETRKKISIIASEKNGKKEKLIELSETNNSTQDDIEERNQRNFSKLEKAERNILDIENRGNKISRDLVTHTETMIKVNSNLEGMDESLTDSSSTIKKMLRREGRNKMLILIVGISLILIFITVVAMRFTNSKTSTVVINQNQIPGEITVMNKDLKDETISMSQTEIPRI